MWGGSPLSDCICRAKPKTPIFENGQFSDEHLIFYKKNNFFGEQNFFTPINKNFCFFEKKHFFFFLKKKFFLDIFFEKKFFQNFKKFSAHKKFMNFFLNFFKTNIFFQKKKNAFFQKNKSSCFLG